MTSDTFTFHILTLFPEIFDSVFSQSIIKRAIGKKIVKINLINPREYATDKHKSVDDKPYGGGMGMVMRPDIVIKALESISTNSYKLLLCASGQKYTQKTAQKLKSKREIVLICGHYEGVDARVEKYVDEVISVGDFVMTGGEIPAMAIVDSITRLLPGVITEGSTKSESFSPVSSLQFPVSSLLEYPQYTRPESFRGQKVPKVLLSGDHKKIEQWRKKESLKRTKKFRPDLLR
ncbi:MAG: tRNA (guanosine(37)-N1)-methyltransferase TrmD [Candidatus Curtissbacteria bacterium]|nr:tRNA (guanosine(37)-N1)-methyltransferase TrmD [Candidatus Curtissbacteria bacterium]